MLQLSLLNTTVKLFSRNVLYIKKASLSFLLLTLYLCVLDAMYDYAGETNELLVIGNKSTAGIFATYPSKHLTLLNGFTDQVSIDGVILMLIHFFLLIHKTHSLKKENMIQLHFFSTEQECHIEHKSLNGLQKNRYYNYINIVFIYYTIIIIQYY